MMDDLLYHLAKEINFPFDAYEENLDADAEWFRSKVRGLVRRQAGNVGRGGVEAVPGGFYVPIED